MYSKPMLSLCLSQLQETLSPRKHWAGLVEAQQGEPCGLQSLLSISAEKSSANSSIMVHKVSKHSTTYSRENVSVVEMLIPILQQMQCLCQDHSFVCQVLTPAFVSKLCHFSARFSMSMNQLYTSFLYAVLLLHSK